MINKNWKIIFFGSSEFSMPAFEAIYNTNDTVVLTVSSQPAPKGRGRKITSSPVAQKAKEYNLNLLETNSLKNEEIVNKIKSFEPDLLVVAAYGAFLPNELLELGEYPPINIHPSLLPKHRGAAPVPWAIINGDAEMGVSIISLVKEMDAGPILKQEKINFEIGESAGILEDKLANLGATLLLQTIKEIKTNTVHSQKQNPNLATINPLLKKQNGYINWHKTSKEIVGLINGTDPWPGTQALMENDKSIKFFNAIFNNKQGSPGEILGLTADKKLIVATKDSSVAISYLQVAGKNKVTAEDFLKGYKINKFNSKVE